jgi:Ca2+/Na+ antiporter
MKTNSTKLNEAIDNYVRSVRILLATVIIVPILALIGYYAPLILLTMLWLPPCFIVLALLTRENEKIKEISEWTTWMDNKMADPRYLNALLYIHHRQLAHALDPTEPHYFFCTSDLDYETFLKQKYQYKHF